MRPAYEHPPRLRAEKVWTGGEGRFSAKETTKRQLTNGTRLLFVELALCITLPLSVANMIL